MATAIYLISSDDLETNQYRLALLIERAKSEGNQYKIFSEIYDKKGNQPLKKELLARIYKKEFDTILTYRLREWSGSADQLSMELDELNADGIRFISCYENYDSFSVTGKLYLQVLLTLNECKPSIDSGTKEIGISKVKSVNQQFPQHIKTVRNATEENPAGLNYFVGKIPSDEINSSGNGSIPGTGKNSPKMDSFDLVGLSEACLLTGYSRHTIYQLTSRKLIPHFKRPNGRRIFFSKKALQQWIMTGEI